MIKNRFPNFYIPKSSSSDRKTVKLLNFMIIGQYFGLVVVSLCTLFEVLKTVFIALVADSSSGGLSNYLLLKSGYGLSYVGLLCLLMFSNKFTIFAVFKVKNNTSITADRMYWLMTTGISHLLTGVIVILISSEILSKLNKIELVEGAINTNQTYMQIVIMTLCLVYVLGKVQDFRNNLKTLNKW